MSQSHKCGQQFLNTAGHIFTIIIPLFLAVLLLLSVLIFAFRGQIRVIVNNDLPEDIYVMRIEEKDLQDLIDQEKLKPEETRKFVANSFRDCDILATSSCLLLKRMPLAFINCR